MNATATNQADTYTTSPTGPSITLTDVDHVQHFRIADVPPARDPARCPFEIEAATFTWRNDKLYRIEVRGRRLKASPTRGVRVWTYTTLEPGELPAWALQIVEDAEAAGQDHPSAAMVTP